MSRVKRAPFCLSARSHKPSAPAQPQLPEPPRSILQGRWLVLGLLGGALLGCLEVPDRGLAATARPTLSGDGGAGGAGGLASAERPRCVAGAAVYPGLTASLRIRFVLDRSASMQLPLTSQWRAAGSGGAPAAAGPDDHTLSAAEPQLTRWAAVQAGLLALLDRWSIPDTRAALTLFPLGEVPVAACADCDVCPVGAAPESSCEQALYEAAPPLLPLVQQQIAQLKALVIATQGELYTTSPLAPALSGSIRALSGLRHDGASAVVLLTDGEPSCCGAAAEQAAAAVQAAATGYADHGIRTFVVGFDNGEVTAASAGLSAIAVAGGTARYSGCESYDDCAYSAAIEDFHVELSEALQQLARQAISCAYPLPVSAWRVPSLAAIRVSLRRSDGATVAVPRDVAHQDGWDLTADDRRSVQLYGDSCELLRADPGSALEIVVPCAPPP